ncbi:MAG: Uma2 family endonuclease [Cytophagales bacterium]|jgi:Uma2 family endonuclease|nr:Uma2 family endonuclease [Cytophagales bacterium]
MGHAQPQKTHYTVEEYFGLDNNSEIRYEFYDGEVFAMAGGTKNHNRIVRNLNALLLDSFAPRGCDVFAESVKLEAIKDLYYPYPDVMLTCDDRDSNDEYLVVHPSLIVEVLSPSTANYDRDFKLKKYQQIPSLQHYLLVSQYECSVEVYSRIGQSAVWTYQLFTDMTDQIRLESLDFTLPVAKIYANIRFVQPPPDHGKA